MDRYGWRLLFCTEFCRQRGELKDAANRARRKDPQGFASDANVRLLRAVDRVVSEVIPQDPSRAEYRQGNTLGRGDRHWRRARIGGRFRVFFRYDSTAKVIVYAWINDEHALRSAGSRTDPYTVFARMLAQGNPPNDWASLITCSERNPQRKQERRADSCDEADKGPGCYQEREMSREKKTVPADHPTPMTAEVLAVTGGWPAIIREEFEWLEEDEDEARRLASDSDPRGHTP